MFAGEEEKAVELVKRMSSNVPIRCNFARIKQMPLTNANRVTIVLRHGEFARYARDFLAGRDGARVIGWT